MELDRKGCVELGLAYTFEHNTIHFSFSLWLPPFTVGLALLLVLLAWWLPKARQPTAGPVYQPRASNVSSQPKRSDKMI
jgi:hypothetical protein